MRVMTTTVPPIQAGELVPMHDMPVPTDAAGKPQHPSWMPVPDHVPAYLRTSGQLLEAMRDLEARFPKFVKLVDIGDSRSKVDGRGGSDIWMLKVTNQKLNPTRKPVAMHVAGVHAREVANPELLLRWVTKQLEGYGTDAAATALLDTRELHVIPLVNPDGHDVVTKAFAEGINPHIWQRKNTAAPDGVDLNRNFRWHWGDMGASRDPDNETYRGPSAASEPETQAVQAAMEESRPGMFIDWHSFSGLNLYPWGDTFGKAPDHVDLEAVAKRFTTMNGYTPQPSVDLYPTSGTTVDHAYGVHRIPAFCIETGDAFHPLEPEFADIQRRNEPILAWSSQVADDALERVHGPAIADVTVGADGSIRATASDSVAGANAIRAAEWTTDPVKFAPGFGTPLAAVDGAYDGVDELLAGTFTPPKPNPYVPTPKLVYVRAQDVEGNWGPATAQWITQPTAST